MTANEERMMGKGTDECKGGTKIRKALEAAMGCDQCEDGMGWVRSTVSKDIHHEPCYNYSFKEG